MGERDDQRYSAEALQQKAENVRILTQKVEEAERREEKARKRYQALNKHWNEYLLELNTRVSELQKDLPVKLEDMASELRAVKRDNKDKDEEIFMLRDKLLKREEELLLGQESSVSLKSKLEDAERELQGIQAFRESERQLQAEIERVRGELGKHEREHIEVSRQLAEARRALAMRDQEVSRLQASVQGQSGAVEAELARANERFDSEMKRKEADYTELRSEMERLLAEKDKQLLEAKADKQRSLDTLRSDAEDELRRVRESKDGMLRGVVTDKDEKLRDLRVEMDRALIAAKEASATELRTVQGEHLAAIEKQREASRAELQALRAQHAAEITAAKKEATDELARLSQDGDSRTAALAQECERRKQLSDEQHKKLVVLERDLAMRDEAVRKLEDEVESLKAAMANNTSQLSEEQAEAIREQVRREEKEKRRQKKIERKQSSASMKRSGSSHSLRSVGSGSRSSITQRDSWRSSQTLAVDLVALGDDAGDERPADIHIKTVAEDGQGKRVERLKVVGEPFQGGCVRAKATLVGVESKQAKFQWFRASPTTLSWRPIAGATSPAYVTSVDDISHLLRVTCTIDNGAPVASGEFGAVVMAPEAEEALVQFGGKKAVEFTVTSSSSSGKVVNKTLLAGLQKLKIKEGSSTRAKAEYSPEFKVFVSSGADFTIHMDKKHKFSFTARSTKERDLIVITLRVFSAKWLSQKL